MNDKRGRKCVDSLCYSLTFFALSVANSFKKKQIKKEKGKSKELEMKERTEGMKMTKSTNSPEDQSTNESTSQ